MEIQFVGDVHGEFDRLEPIVQNFAGMTIQLGDLGIGFRQRGMMTDVDYDNDRFAFIRGNHDNPSICRRHDCYLGEYGMWNGIFYVSGAYSIDRWLRTDGIDWWHDEELSMAQCYKAQELYSAKKPSVVISHDCPSTMVQLMYHELFPNRTGDFLQNLLEIHQPDLWLFGHHHLSFERKICNTTFRCLDCFETFKYNVK